MPQSKSKKNERKNSAFSTLRLESSLYVANAKYASTPLLTKAVLTSSTSSIIPWNDCLTTPDRIPTVQYVPFVGRTELRKSVT